MSQEINKEIVDVLKEFKINTSAGLLVLLGLYYQLDVDTVCPEEAVKAINLTKIVEREYPSGNLKWNMPLFNGQQTEFDWVGDWMESFGRMNPERKGSSRDAKSRMKDFFRKYPEYRKDDVYAARDLYLKSLNNPQYCMHSHKFIFDGTGAMKKSTLLAFCERVKEGSTSKSNMKGKLM